MPRTGGPPSPLPLPLPLPPCTATHRKYSIGGRSTRNCICLLVLPTYLPTSAIMYTVWPVLYLRDPSPPAPRSTSAGASTHRTRGGGSPDGAPHRWTSLPPTPAPVQSTTRTRQGYGRTQCTCDNTRGGGVCPARWLHGQRVSVVRRSRASPMRHSVGP